MNNLSTRDLRFPSTLSLVSTAFNTVHILNLTFFLSRCFPPSRSSWLRPPPGWLVRRSACKLNSPEICTHPTQFFANKRTVMRRATLSAAHLTRQRSAPATPSRQTSSFVVEMGLPIQGTVTISPSAPYLSSRGKDREGY